MLAWAATAVADDVIPIGLIARVMLLVCVVVALCAATAALVVFLACGRLGIVRRPEWRRRGAAIAIASSWAWILASAWQEGRTTLNVFAIATAELAAVALYLTGTPYSPPHGGVFASTTDAEEDATRCGGCRYNATNVSVAQHRLGPTCDSKH